MFVSFFGNTKQSLRFFFGWGRGSGGFATNRVGRCRLGFLGGGRWLLGAKNGDLWGLWMDMDISKVGFSVFLFFFLSLLSLCHIDAFPFPFLFFHLPLLIPPPAHPLHFPLPSTPFPLSPPRTKPSISTRKHDQHTQTQSARPNRKTSSRQKQNSIQSPPFAREICSGKSRRAGRRLFLSCGWDSVDGGFRIGGGCDVGYFGEKGGREVGLLIWWGWMLEWGLWEERRGEGRGSRVDRGWYMRSIPRSCVLVLARAETEYRVDYRDSQPASH